MSISILELELQIAFDWIPCIRQICTLLRFEEESKLNEERGKRKILNEDELSGDVK